jgi:hypothetical protein
MRKSILATVLLLIILTATAACQKSGSGNTAETGTENLSIMPFSERRFVFTNGLDYSEKLVSSQEGSTKISKSYLVFSGFKNKDVEEKINQDAARTIDQTMEELLANTAAENGGKAPVPESKESSANVVYNCNNVLFIECYANEEFTVNSELVSRQRLKAVGYDLNTGAKLQLKDLFKKGSGYEKMINDYILMHIIENNYDDPDSAFMSKPFQGIREGQSFSFSVEGLKIILDEKNDEFEDLGYPNTVNIPLSVIGDELAVFDRYYDGKTNLFEKNGIKKLLPNLSEFKVTKLFQESGKNYNIYIEEGEFINIADAAVKTMLDNLTVCRIDLDGFRKKAAAQAAANPGENFGNVNHDVSTMFNAGGYMSIVVWDAVYENGEMQETAKYVNYDFNNKSMMKLKDIFFGNFDYKTAIALIINNQYKEYNPDHLADVSKDAISEEDFFFDESGLEIHLNPQSEESYRSFWIPYEKIGWENLALFGGGTGKAEVNQYIIAGSDSRYLTDSDLSALTKEQLEIARNEIFARHGYVFKTQYYIDYFNSKSWYKPDPNYSGNLSGIEEYNVNLIKKYESEH